VHGAAGLTCCPPARTVSEMAADTLRVGITCYPSVGGSGVLATSLGEDLAARGHDVHFIAYERPCRLPPDPPRLHFHPVAINEYELFRFPDYTLPLSVRMAEVSRDHRLDVLHVHYAVPHATAAILARAMLPPGPQPRVVTTLHGTDTTLLGHDAGYAPAIKHALTSSDAVTAASESLKHETQRVIVREKVHAIEDYLQIADVGLYTSDAESFCLSILEAMCFGCPSVSTRVGGIPEVVEDNESGLLVPAGNVAALATALEALVHDEPRRHALGRAAQARARERFSAEVIVPRYEALYRRLCR